MSGWAYLYDWLRGAETSKGGRGEKKKEAGKKNKETYGRAEKGKEREIP